jgi:hypothetical protein
MLTMTELHPGLLTVLLSMNENQAVPFCGYMANIPMSPTLRIFITADSIMVS